MCYLRKANLNDFEAYKDLFEDKEYRYQWLYNHPQQIIGTVEEPDDEDEFAIVTAEFQNYTLQRFYEDLENFTIFMVCDKKQILGYIKIAKSVRDDKCKIHECALFKEDNQIKEEIFTKLKSKKNAKQFYLFTSEQTAIEFLLKIGFKREEKSSFILQKS